ncbi:lipopolysaccharide biosynthesis protein [Buttiauxella gaviniae]|uniref:lipopolysaccharide biosynthesis protein n=1 Tax=Buttiauxella gaviniae TaxID=82990 RepID=UPI003BB5770F
MTELKDKTVSGLKWSAIERLFTQGIQLVIMLLLANKLGPQAFGLIGMLAIFISIAQVFVDSGFSSALIRKVNRQEVDFSTAFLFNVFVAVVSYIVIYLAAPKIANFYNQPELKEIARYMSLVILSNSFTMVPRTKLTIKMDFKSQAKVSIISVVLSGVTALYMAYNGFGVWSLVVQTLLSSIFSVILINVFCPWKPAVKFSLESFRYLFGFGGKILISGLMEAIYNNLYQVIIGKKFDAVHLGYFTQANQLSSIPAMTISNIIQRVTYPLFCEIQEEAKQMEDSYMLALKSSAAVTFLAMCCLSAIATPFMVIFLGPGWEGAGVLVSILAIGYMLYPIHAINLNILYVKGRSDIFLKVDIIKKIIGLVLLMLTLPFGVTYMCWGIVAHSYISLVVNMYCTKSVSKYSILQQFKCMSTIWLFAIFSLVLTKYISIVYIHSLLMQLLFSVFFLPGLCMILMYYLERDFFTMLVVIVKKQSPFGKSK